MHNNRRTQLQRKGGFSLKCMCHPQLRMWKYRTREIQQGITKLIRLQLVQSPAWSVSRLQVMNLTVRYQDGDASLGFQFPSDCSQAGIKHQLPDLMCWFHSLQVLFSLTCPTSWDTQHQHCNGHSYDQHQALSASFQAERLDSLSKSAFAVYKKPSGWNPAVIEYKKRGCTQVILFPEAYPLSGVQFT